MITGVFKNVIRFISLRYLRDHNVRSMPKKGGETFNIAENFPLFGEEDDAITVQEDTIVEFTCDYKIGRYDDPFLQVSVVPGHDLHVEKLLIFGDP